MTSFLGKLYFLIFGMILLMFYSIVIFYWILKLDSIIIYVSLSWLFGKCGVCKTINGLETEMDNWSEIKINIHFYKRFLKRIWSEAMHEICNQIELIMKPFYLESRLSGKQWRFIFLQLLVSTKSIMKPSININPKFSLANSQILTQFLQTGIEIETYLITT